jgi:hypothetical protein
MLPIRIRELRKLNGPVQNKRGVLIRKVWIYDSWPLTLSLGESGVTLFIGFFNFAVMISHDKE